MSEEESKPWWYYLGCHEEHVYYTEDGKERGCLKVLRETEGAAVVLLGCRDEVHIAVQAPGGYSCTWIRDKEYYDMTEAELMAMVQNQRNQLRSVL